MTDFKAFWAVWDLLRFNQWVVYHICNIGIGIYFVNHSAQLPIGLNFADFQFLVFFFSESQKKADPYVWRLRISIIWCSVKRLHLHCLSYLMSNCYWLFSNFVAFFRKYQVLQFLRIKIRNLFLFLELSRSIIVWTF